MDMVAAWLCLSYALSEDAPTCIERVSFTTFAPSTTYAKCSCPWCLVSAVRVADIYCEFVSIITFSYISGLGTSGRLSTQSAPIPVYYVPSLLFAIFCPPVETRLCFSDWPLERCTSKINENSPLPQKGRVSILQQPHVPGKASFCK